MRSSCWLVAVGAVLSAAAASAIAGEPTDVMSQLQARVNSCENAYLSAQITDTSLLSADELVEHEIAKRQRKLESLDKQEADAKTDQRLAELARQRATIERLLPDYVEVAQRNAKVVLEVQDWIDFPAACWRREDVDARPGIRNQSTRASGTGMYADQTKTVLNIASTSFFNSPGVEWIAFPGPGYKPIVTYRLLGTLHPSVLTGHGRTWTMAQTTSDDEAYVEVTVRDSEGIKRDVIRLQPDKGYAMKSWQSYGRSGAKLDSFEFSDFVQRAGQWVPTQIVEIETGMDGRPLRKIVRRNEVIEINADIPAERFAPPADPDIYGRAD
jgi:hypothetical protein